MGQGADGEERFARLQELLASVEALAHGLRPKPQNPW